MAYRPGPKYKSEAFTSVEAAYLDMVKLYIANPNFFTYSRPHKTLKLSGREIFGLILMAHMQEHLTGERWVPGTDPFGHDGAVARAGGDRQGEGHVYEQVFVPALRPGEQQPSLEGRILEAIKSKSDRGEAYRAGTDLVVFVNRRGVLGDLRQLAADTGQFGYRTVYVIAQAVPQNGPDELEYVCLMLLNPLHAPGPFAIRINRKTGVGQVNRIMS